MAAACGGARAASLFYIHGGGDGHGIGMSQYGAYGYALHGKSYQWILAHYYQGTSLGHDQPRPDRARAAGHRLGVVHAAPRRAGAKQLEAGNDLPRASRCADGSLTARDRRRARRSGTLGGAADGRRGPAR